MSLLPQGRQSCCSASLTPSPWVTARIATPLGLRFEPESLQAFAQPFSRRPSLHVLVLSSHLLSMPVCSFSRPFAHTASSVVDSWLRRWRRIIYFILTDSSLGNGYISIARWRGTTFVVRDAQGLAKYRQQTNIALEFLNKSVTLSSPARHLPSHLHSRFLMVFTASMGALSLADTRHSSKRFALYGRDIL